MGEVDPTSPFKPLAYIWLTLIALLALVLCYRFAGYIYNWEFVSIYYYDLHPLWYYVARLIFELAVIVVSIYGIIQVYGNRVRVFQAAYYPVIISWIESLFSVVVGMADRFDRIMFVFVTFFIILYVYTLAKDN